MGTKLKNEKVAKDIFKIFKNHEIVNTELNRTEPKPNCLKKLEPEPNH